jgi:hypothetical protein
LRDKALWANSRTISEATSSAGVAARWASAARSAFSASLEAFLTPWRLRYASIRAPRPADSAGGLVARDQDKGSAGPEVENAFEPRKQGEKGVPQPDDGPDLLEDEVAPVADEQFELGEQFVAGFEGGEVPSHPGLFGDEPGVAGVGLGLAAVGIARPVHRDAGRVEHPLALLPKERQEQSGAPAGLIDGPGNLLRSRSEDLLEKGGEVGLIVLDPAREQDTSLSVEHHRPVEPLPGIDADPHPVHGCLLRVYGSDEPSGLPAVGSLRSDRSSPISISDRGIPRSRGANPPKPSDGRILEAIPGSSGRSPGYVIRGHKQGREYCYETSNSAGYRRHLGAHDGRTCCECAGHYVY